MPGAYAEVGTIWCYGAVGRAGALGRWFGYVPVQAWRLDGGKTLDLRFDFGLMSVQVVWLAGLELLGGGLAAWAMHLTPL